jgi:hypothetical protein
MTEGPMALNGGALTPVREPSYFGYAAPRSDVWTRIAPRVRVDTSIRRDGRLAFGDERRGTRVASQDPRAAGKAATRLGVDCDWKQLNRRVSPHRIHVGKC